MQTRNSHSSCCIGDADRDSLHVASADEAIRSGPPPARVSYLNGASIVDTAIRSSAQGKVKVIRRPRQNLLSRTCMLDAARVVIQLRNEAERLKEMNDELQAKVNELKGEKNELHDENNRLKEEKEKLEQQDSFGSLSFKFFTLMSSVKTSMSSLHFKTSMSSESLEDENINFSLRKCKNVTIRTERNSLCAKCDNSRSCCPLFLLPTAPEASNPQQPQVQDEPANDIERFFNKYVETD
ncbi:hypothetical protein JHK87_010116 [Glycine soja]|nr:hypothetical protein JHK87_010116 [Glycine soja]